MSTEYSPSGPPSGGAGGSGPSGPRASFGTRFLAALIDGILLGVVGAVVGAILGLDLSGRQGIQLIIGLAYFGYLEGSPSGQTLGKRAMGIRVIDFSNGGPIGVGRALIRFVGRYISAIACLVGYFWMLWDKEKQTWHDKMANSVVVPTSDYPVAAWPG
jgi:uncharacterized RDD family membrane protein YckC